VCRIKKLKKRPRFTRAIRAIIETEIVPLLYWLYLLMTANYTSLVLLIHILRDVMIQDVSYKGKSI
jgi:hypothetical protein